MRCSELLNSVRPSRERGLRLLHLVLWVTLKTFTMATPTTVAADMPSTYGGATVNHQRLLTHCMDDKVRDWPALAKKHKHENGRAFPTSDTQPDALKACAALTVLRVHVATKCQVNEKAMDGGMPEGVDDQFKRIIYARMAVVLQAAADDAGATHPESCFVGGI